MKAGHRNRWERRSLDQRFHTDLAAILILEAVFWIGLAPDAMAQGDSGRTSRQERAISSKTTAAGVAEAVQKGIATAPTSAEAWAKRADLFLERFRVLELKLRSSQSGMAVMLRLQAAGLYSGQESREELLRQSATADAEQQGIWGELGVEQVWCGKREEAAATLKIALERQPNDLWTLRLEALMKAAHGDWKGAESKLLELGSRSPAVLHSALQSWPRNLIPKEYVEDDVWACAGKKNATGCDRMEVVANQAQGSEEQFLAEERWEKLAALPGPLPTQTAAWFRRGVALAELHECARAIPMLERGLEVGAETAAHRLELCYAAEADHAAERIGALGNQAVFHRVRGDFLVRVKGAMPAATEEYEKARQLDPRDPVPAERLAQACENIGDMPRAKQAAREALALDPHRAVSLRLFASIAMNERDYPNALDSLNKLLAKRPNDAWTRVQLGIAYAQTGQSQEALANLQPPLAAGYPDERGALHAMLARVLRKLGREQEAQSAAAESDRLSSLFQQHGSTPVTPPEERR